MVQTPDHFVPRDHPIRRIKPLAERALAELSPTFDGMYSAVGRPSIPPEHLLKGCLLMALFSVRSERQFCEQLQYNLLFKWFLDLNVADPAFDASTFSKNRQRLLEHSVASAFFDEVLAIAQEQRLLSEEHFSVDGTLLEAYASMKSVRPRDEDEGSADGGQSGTAGSGGRNRWVDFRGKKRTNATHYSTTDPEALLARKGPGKETKLSYAGHVLMENRSGITVDVLISQATGRAEREAAVLMLDRRPRRRRATLGADRAYDTEEFVEACRERAVTPHIAQNRSGRRSRIDGRTTRHEGYKISQRMRMRTEEIFGWIKTVAGGRKLRFIGLQRNQFWAELTVSAYNLLRITKLAPALA
jgi:transposase